MDIKLQEILFLRYPKLFRRHEVPDAPIDERGIECGDGWFALVERLASAGEAEIVALQAQGVPPSAWPRVAQIKEKFGSLRFYLDGNCSEQFSQLIRETADRLSVTVCEECGMPGQLRNGRRYVRTTCDACEAGQGSRSMDDFAAWERRQAEIRVLLDARVCFDGQGGPAETREQNSI